VRFYEKAQAQLEGRWHLVPIRSALADEAVFALPGVQAKTEG
jgi:hypothetical protein